MMVRPVALLEEATYPAVAHNMIGAFAPHLPSPANPDSTLVGNSDFARSFDLTFARQMYELHKQGNRPDAFLVTADSAVPVADAIRGYYDEAGFKSPLITYIKANRRLAQTVTAPETIQQREIEQSRLNKVLEGILSACIIDQLVMSGSTLRMAAAMVMASGVPKIHTIGGEWYHQADIEPNDLQTVSSRHSNFL